MHINYLWSDNRHPFISGSQTLVQQELCEPQHLFTLFFYQD